MDQQRIGLALALVATAIGMAPIAQGQAGSECVAVDGAAPRNLIVFVADGLRAGSVTAHGTPALYGLAADGVRFTNSHSVVPTLTTPNAAAIATGHLPGDTGDYANTLVPGFRIFDTGNFGRSAETPAPYLEGNQVLGDLDAHFGGNWLGEASLLELARSHCYSTAAIGKVGPSLMQDVSQAAPAAGRFAAPLTLVLDDATGTSDGLPLPEDAAQALRAAGLPIAAPGRINPPGDSRHAGVRAPNHQQFYFIEATTRVVLPLLASKHRPFALVYWSRDPDVTQHNQGDSLNQLRPGINGPSSRAAVANADDNLRRLLEAVRADPGLAANTDVFVTSDHGFSTISKRSVDAAGHATASHAATLAYMDVPEGFLPPGFLAIDIAHELGDRIYDPDRPYKDATGTHYAAVRPGEPPQPPQAAQHPALGNALLVDRDAIVPPGEAATPAHVIVAANGGVDLLYLPERDAALLHHIVEFLSRQDYVGGLFVDDDYGAVPGALPLGALGLKGSSAMPRPALLVALKHFYAGVPAPGAKAVARKTASLLEGMLVADTPLQQGQGMHGAMARDNTFNFMAAWGPDFKLGAVVATPAGNADIAPTLAAALGWQWPAHGTLAGRVVHEALRKPAGEPAGGKLAQSSRCRRVSEAAANGRRTILEVQRWEGREYADQAYFSTEMHAGTLETCL